MIWIILLGMVLIILLILIPCVVTSSRVSKEEEYNSIVKELKSKHKNNDL